MINTLKTIDRSAPRFKPTSVGLLNQEFIDSFKEKFPQYANVPSDLLKKIVESFNGKMWQGVIDNRDGVELPEGLGNIFIGSCKPAKANVNYKASNELGERIMNRNMKTDGYIAKIFYTNYEAKYKFRFRRMWKFKGVRQFTNGVSVTYSEEWPRYLVIEDYMKISSLFRYNRKTEIMNKKVEDTVIPDTYNEFDLD